MTMAQIRPFQAGIRGSAGGRPLWTPPRVAPCPLWLPARRVQGAEGLGIVAFPDRSGLANTPIQATASQQPLYKASGPNGKPYILPDGVDDNMILLSTAQALTGTSFTLWSVFNNPENIAAIEILFALQTGTGVGRNRLDFAFTAANLFQIDAAFSVTNGLWTSPAPSASVWHSIIYTYDGSAAGNAPVIYLDGVSQTVTTVTPAVGAFTGSIDTVKLFTNASSSTPTDTSWADGGLYTAILNAGQINRLLQYINQTYAIAVTYL